MSKFKLPLLFFIAAFIFSSFLGMVNGVAFFKLLLRALISGSLLAVFSFCARIVLGKYIPELFEKEAEKELDKVAQSLGNNLNISIGDGEISYFDESGPREDNVSDNYEAESGNGFPEIEEIEKEDSVNGQAEISKTENEPAELLPVFQETFAAENSQKEDSALRVAAVKEIPEQESILEELPDLQEFQPVHFTEEKQEKVEDFTETGTDSFLATDLSEGKSDSNLIAKAIQTVLRRE